MRVTADKAFNPVTIELETADELKKLKEILNSAITKNNTNCYCTHLNSPYLTDMKYSVEYEARCLADIILADLKKL